MTLIAIQGLRLCSWITLPSNRIGLYCLARTNEGGPRNPSRNTPPSLKQSSVAPSAEPVGWLNKISTSLPDSTQTSPEKGVLSENSNSFLDSYTGTKPLIGEHKKEYSNTWYIFQKMCVKKYTFTVCCRIR